MTETPFFFGKRASELFGILHLPEPSRSQSRAGFVFCHPFGEEKLWTHRVFVTFARELARRGYPVLRFDYTGNGDSHGEFTDWSIRTALEDIYRASDELKVRTGCDDLGLLGLRLGASLAACVAEDREDVSSLMLWAPIVDGRRYMQELLRVNLTTQMAVYREIKIDREGLVRLMEQGNTVNVDGYDLSLPLYEQLSRLHLNEGTRKFAGRCLLVQVERSEKARPSKELEDLRGKYPNAALEIVREEPFWKEIDRFYDKAPNLFASTIEWLERR
jgi:uncharacterized protein